MDVEALKNPTSLKVNIILKYDWTQLPQVGGQCSSQNNESYEMNISIKGSGKLPVRYLLVIKYTEACNTI